MREKKTYSTSNLTTYSTSEVDMIVFSTRIGLSFACLLFVNNKHWISYPRKFCKRFVEPKKKKDFGLPENNLQILYWLLKVQKVFASFVKTLHLAFKFFVFKEMIVLVCLKKTTIWLEVTLLSNLSIASFFSQKSIIRVLMIAKKTFFSRKLPIRPLKSTVFKEVVICLSEVSERNRMKNRFFFLKSESCFDRLAFVVFS